MHFALAPTGALGATTGDVTVMPAEFVYVHEVIGFGCTVGVGVAVGSLVGDSSFVSTLLVNESTARGSTPADTGPFGVSIEVLSTDVLCLG